MTSQSASIGFADQEFQIAELEGIIGMLPEEDFLGRGNLEIDDLHGGFGASKASRLERRASL